jgi:outer membrane protein assembly factor BamB
VGTSDTTICSVWQGGNRPTLALVFAYVLQIVTPISARQTPAPADVAKTESALRLVALDARWVVNFPTAPSAPSGFDQHAAYVPLKGGELVAVGLEAGEIRWKVPITTAATPATGDGLVFAAGDGAVIAFEERTGTVVWQTKVNESLAGPVAFDAGAVMVSKRDGELLTIRAQDGSVLWQQPLAAPLAIPPSGAGDRLFAGLDDGRVLALDRETGAPAWTHKVDGAVTGLLALDDQVVVGTRGNRVYSLKPESGRQRWEWRVGADVAGAPVADEKRIYFAALDHVLRAVDRGNGNLRWTAKLPSRPAGGPLRTGDVVIVPTVSADIGAYSAETGKAAFTIKAASELGGIPYLREGARPTATRLVAVSRDGVLQGFAPRFEPPPTAFNALPNGVKVGG